MAKCNQILWQPVARDGLAGLDRQGSALQAAQFRKDQLGSFGACQDRTGFDEKQLASPVSSIPRPTRWNSLAPYRASNTAIAALAADCAMLPRRDGEEDS